MKILIVKMIAGLLLALSIQGLAQADTITTLFNTGVNSLGIKLGAGAIDPNYSFSLQPPMPGGLVPMTVPDGQFPFPPWVANQSDSRWIGPNQFVGLTTTIDPMGTYRYLTTFTLPYNTVLSTVKLVFNMAVDDPMTNGNEILLNGTVVYDASGVGFNPFTSITLNSGFQLGVNSLEFQVINGPALAGNPSGLQVEFTTKSYTTPAPTLNNVTFLTLLMLALGTWGFVSRRQKT